METQHEVTIRAVVDVVERGLTPRAGDMISVADCQRHTDWLQLENGQVIPTKDKSCIVKKVAKNGSFFACGRWYRSGIAQAYVFSSFFGTRIVYL
ncbi:hypothetical protein [Methylomonas koyamae]|uniref:hypothetical protein n=1 Tax=Methylomonas koyamae TaxID=702114 RepID=UPI00112ADE9D|nr:hypothetical protein [Methylomonas koyamae]TPQ24915.1 hypothetical protein C2U68_17205 [Methylomonas koyamae]